MFYSDQKFLHSQDDSQSAILAPLQMHKIEKL